VRFIEPSEFLTAADLRDRYRVSRMWITRRINQFNFPKPARLDGPCAPRRWHIADLDARTRVQGVNVS